MHYTMEVRLAVDAEVVPDEIEEMIKKELETFGNAGVRLVQGKLIAARIKMTSSQVTTTKCRYDKDKMIDVLVEKLIHKDVPGDCLDEAVHEIAASSAAVVNNQGLEAQLRFLLEEVELEETNRIVNAVLVDEGVPQWYLIEDTARSTCTMASTTKKDDIDNGRRGIRAAGDAYQFYSGFFTEKAARAFAREKGWTITEIE